MPRLKERSRMKESAFDPSLQSVDFEETPSLTLSHTPLPQEVPKAVDLSHLPTSVLRSGAMESLMSQNEDLLSRLSVSLRRIAQLEEKLNDSEKSKDLFRTQYESLKDQILVLKEKSRLLATRKDREESEYQNLKNQIRMLEIRYAELYSSTQIKESNLLQKVSLLSKLVGRHKRYHERIKKAAKSIKTQLQNKKALEKKLVNQEDLIRDIRTNLEKSTHYISELNRQHKEELGVLTEKYEIRLKSAKNEKFELENKITELNNQSQSYDKLYEEKVQLENELVITQRHSQDYKERTSLEVSELQKSLTEYKKEANRLALELENNRTERTEKAEEVQRMSEENRRLSEQVENLQVLWRENQKKLERADERSRSLQKLNQDLSVSLNQYRREIRKLKEGQDAQDSLEREDGAPLKNNRTANQALEAKIDSLFGSIHGSNEGQFK